jgi:hypothetical protein
MASFKQFGGLAYNSKHNITGATHTVNAAQVVTGTTGNTNTRSTINSHVDLSGSSLLQVGGVHFADGTVMQTAPTENGNGSGSGGTYIDPPNPSWEHLIGPEGPSGVDGVDGTDGINTSLITDTLENTSIGTDNLKVAGDGSKYNVAMGKRVLMKTVTGYANSGVGYETLINNVHGSFNTAVGLQALAYNVVGAHNTAIGAGADVTNPSLTNSTAIGAGARVDASNTIRLGNKFVTNVVTSGTITGLAKNFTIDHPLPDMKVRGHSLKHASVEAPRLDLMYRDTVTLADGEATINLDEMFHMTEGTFASLCSNPSIFVTNESDWDPVRGYMETDTENVLHIRCKNVQSRARVSFLVIAERKDTGVLESSMTDDTGRFVPEPDIHCINS